MRGAHVIVFLIIYFLNTQECLSCKKKEKNVPRNLFPLRVQNNNSYHFNISFQQNNRNNRGFIVINDIHFEQGEILIIIYTFLFHIFFRSLNIFYYNYNYYHFYYVLTIKYIANSYEYYIH